MATSLADVLDDNHTPEAPKEEVPPKEDAGGDAPPQEKVERVTSRRAQHREKEYAAQGRAADGKFLPKDAPAEAPKADATPPAQPAEAPKAPAEQPKPPEQDMSPRERAAFAKAADETRKRQAAEQEVARLRQAAPPKPEEPKKGFWDDPEAALNAHRQEIRDTAIRTRLDTSELIARSKHTDFDEKVASFSELVSTTPGLAERWLAAADPAEFAYSTAKNHMDLQAAGSLDKMRADIETKARADERKKVEEEFKAKQDELEKKRAALPGTLSDVRGAAPAAAAPVWTGPTSLSDVLHGK